MMKYLLRSPEPVSYESRRRLQSAEFPGVAYSLRRMSLGRRIELTRMVRDLGQKIEFLAAGEDITGKIDGSLLASEIDALYLRWGLAEISGLSIDGEPATAESMISTGPERLVREIVAGIKSECGLSENERKN
jgi:hypothetical protein